MKIRLANRQLIITAIISITIALCALIVPAKADSVISCESGKNAVVFQRVSTQTPDTAFSCFTTRSMN